MKVLPVVVGGSTLTSAGVLALRPSAAVIVVGLIQLGSLLTYGWIQRSLQCQSQRNTLELMDRAKVCQVGVVIHENGRIEIVPADAWASAQPQASPPPAAPRKPSFQALRDRVQRIRCSH